MKETGQNTDDGGNATGVPRFVIEAVLLALISTLFFSWLSIRLEYIGNISDSAVYLTQSDYFSPWRPAPHEIGAMMFHDFSFPPLFPLLLALLGGGTEHPYLSYLATSVMMGAAVGAVYAWMRTLHVGRVPAMGMTLAFSLMPATLLSAMGMQSEPLYAALVFSGLACWNLRESAPRAAPAAAGLLGFSVLARTVGISAIGALLLAWVLEPQQRRKRLVPLLAVAPVAAWVLFKLAAGMNESYVDLVRQDSPAATLAFVFAQMKHNPLAIWHGLVHGFDLLGTSHARLAIGVLTVLFCIGWAVRLRRLETDAMYLLFYVGIIVVWPFPNHMRRFLQVVIPLYLYYVYVGSVTFARFIPGDTARRTAVPAIIIAAIVVMAPSTGAMLGQVHAAEETEAENFVRAPQWYIYDTPLRATLVMGRVQQVLDAMRGIDEHLPRDACVSSALYSFIPLYGRRRAQPVPRVSIDDETFFAAIERCPYVFMMAGSVWPPSESPSMYPHERIKDRLEVIEVSLWDRTASSGTVLTMLGRVRFPDSDGDAR